LICNNVSHTILLVEVDTYQGLEVSLETAATRLEAAIGTHHGQEVLVEARDDHLDPDGLFFGCPLRGRLVLAREGIACWY